MKKLLLLSVVFINLNFASFAFEDMKPVETTEEMKEYLPNKDMSLTFKENPLKFLEAIQLDYHFLTFDQGLKRISEALDYIEPVYKKNKDQMIFPDQLANAEAYKVYSGLLTLKGMMLTKKATGLAGINADNDDEDGMRTQAVENMKIAEESLKKAIELDPNSAEAYFQLGKYYGEASAGITSQAAEEALFTAVKLAKEQGNIKGSEQALALLVNLNPNSEYIEKLNL